MLDWLVLAETFAIYPGWSARVDGAPARLFIANGAATAIALGADASEVVFEYVPPGFRLGMATSLGGLLICMLVLWRLRSRARA